MTLSNIPYFDLPENLILWLSIAIWGYAEIHYRLPGFPGKLFRREPEILFDLPHRSTKHRDIPLFLVVKDADRFPAFINTASIAIRKATSDHIHHLDIALGLDIRDRWFDHTLLLPASMFEDGGIYEVDVKLSYRIGQKPGWLQQDNYPNISHAPFRIFISPAPLPRLPDLYWGDMHTHSNYTDSQIEFGASLGMIKSCAEALNLDLVAVTDHSFDLDNIPGHISKPDPRVRKWKQFLEDCQHFNSEGTGPLLLPGEEVSAGNQKGQNVHCLVLGAPEFFPGSGDGGNIPPFNRPSLSLPALVQSASAHPNAVVAAAHPLDEPPSLHKQLLNRGYWSDRDLLQDGIQYWQILNGRRDASFYSGLEKWKKALLKGRRIYLLAGTDAHGNFNTFRQITIPLIKMVRKQQQLLGQTRTGIFCKAPLNTERILSALKAGNTIISDGPACQMFANIGQKICPLGGEIARGKAFDLTVQVKSTEEFGVLSAISLYIGDLNGDIEEEKKLAIGEDLFDLTYSLSFPEGLQEGYLRLEVKTQLPEQDCIALSNPIWIV